MEHKWFWNIAYFDEPYFKGMFENFVFPDGSAMQWESVSWLQKKFMNWFNEERRKKTLTFPVETMNLLDNGKEYVDKDWADYVAEMYSKGHSFFTYRSSSVDSLASCCFDGKQMCLTKSSNGINFMTFEELYNAPYSDTKRNFTIFHNGSWVKGKVIKTHKKNMYKITTSNKKELFVTEDHIFPTYNGDKMVKNITENDYILFNCRKLDTFPEKDEGLTYEEGYLIGMYLGDGSSQCRENCTPTVNLSLNETKYFKGKQILNTAISKIDSVVELNLGKQYNNVYPVTVRNVNVYNFIKRFVIGDYCYEKELNLDCLLQSYDFRKGILDGYYATDGGNSNRIYTTSKKLVYQIECLITSLGLNSTIDVSDRTDEPVIVRGQVFTRNYPLFCIRWYDPKNKRSSGELFKVKNNCEYFKVMSVEPYDTEDKFVYCFEMENEDEPYFTLPNGVISHNCRLRNEVTENTFSYTLGAGGVSTGSKGVITININRLVQNLFKNNPDTTYKQISEAVREQVDKVHKYLLAYNSYLNELYEAKLLTVYNAGYISLEKQYLTIGINGFVESAEFLGIEISPNDEYFKYGEVILRPIYEENRKAKTDSIMFNTEYVPAENLGVKNAKWDKEDGYFVPRDCYNSYFYKAEDTNINLIDKFILHGDKLTKYLDGRQKTACYTFSTNQWGLSMIS